MLVKLFFIFYFFKFKNNWLLVDKATSSGDRNLLNFFWTFVTRREQGVLWSDGQPEDMSIIARREESNLLLATFSCLLCYYFRNGTLI